MHHTDCHSLPEMKGGTWETGMLQTATARRFGVAVSTISILQQRHLQTCTVHDRSWPWIKKVTTPAHDQSIETAHIHDRFWTTAATEREIQGGLNDRVSRQTVSNQLRDHWIRAHRAYMGPLLKKRWRC